MSNGMKAFFQKLARAFLIPVSLIGVASLIMAIGCIFTDAAIIKIVPFFCQHPHSISGELDGNHRRSGPS